MLVLECKLLLLLLLLLLLSKGINSKDIVNKICTGRQIIGCLNSLRWDKNISLDTKKRFGKSMVESVACYECEIRLLKRE